MTTTAMPETTSPSINMEFSETEALNLVSWVKQQYQKMKSDRQPYERQWRLNYAMYKGRQYVVPMKGGSIVGGAGRLHTPEVPPYRVRAVRNKIKPVVRTEISKLTSNKPNASVVPASTEDEDLFAAQAGEQVWESLYNTKQLHKIFTRSMFWLSICGVSFLKDWWDPYCLDYTKKYEGDIKTAAVTPLHLFVPDLREQEIEDQPYVLNAYTKPVEWMEAYYGKKMNATTVSANEIMGESFFKSQTNDAKPDSVLVLEMWIKPYGHKWFPEGGVVIIAGDELISATRTMLYNHQEYPFVKFDHIPTGEFYSDSVINDLIPPQREYNKTTSQIIEAKNRMARPQLLAALGSIDPSKVTTEPGQIIQYKLGFPPPSPLPLQPLPNYVLDELDRIKSDMEDISSQHEVSHGSAPTGVTAATAISYLQERDDSAMSTTYQSVEFGYEKLARHYLSHVVQFWETSRIVKSVGIDGMFDSINLKGSDIASGTDIRMEAGSALPISKAAKQAFLIDMMKLGFIDPNKGLSMMDMGGVDKLYDELKADERQVQRENLRMRSLKIDDIEAHMKQVEAVELLGQQLMQQQAPQMQSQQVATAMPGLPQDITDPESQQMALDGLDQLEGAISQPPGQPQMPQMDLGAGQDQQSGLPLSIPVNMVPVNTWDNHQLHIELHNQFRKSQAFELLPDQIKAQFEAHVAQHAAVLQQTSINAMGMMPGINPMDNPMGEPHNGSGTPLGSPQDQPFPQDSGMPS